MSRCMLLTTSLEMESTVETAGKALLLTSQSGQPCSSAAVHPGTTATSACQHYAGADCRLMMALCAICLPIQLCSRALQTNPSCPTYAQGHPKPSSAHLCQDLMRPLSPSPSGGNAWQSSSHIGEHFYSDEPPDR